MDTLETIYDIEEKLFSRPLLEVVTKLSYFRRLERAWHLIERDFADPNITLERAAISSGTNKNRLNSLFRQTTNLTFHQLLIRYRILRAIAMMKSKNYSFLEISIETGFGSLNTFERNFRKLIGITPRDYKAYYIFRK